MEKKKIVLASPRGFCAGVVRAIETVRLTLQKYGPPVYVLHEIVHNKHVIAELKEMGAFFVEELTDIPRGEVCIFSAHGVSAETERMAVELGLRTIDATCPLVNSVHKMVESYHGQEFDVVIIGHHGHPEVEGTAGRVIDNGKVHIVATEYEAESVSIYDENKVAYVTQTTLSQVDISGIRSVLKRRFPNIKGPYSNTCYATQNRQNAVEKLAGMTEILLVVGSSNSSNSNRLREVGVKAGIEGHLIDDKNDIDPQWLIGKNKIGVTAGASAPERLVDEVIDWLRAYGFTGMEEMEGKEEIVRFRPAELEGE